MSIPRYHLDSNVLLRFFTGEPVAMFTAASALIERAQLGEIELELSPLVLAETAFTLESFFKAPRKEVAGALSQFVTRLGIRLAEKDRTSSSEREQFKGFGPGHGHGRRPDHAGAH